MSDDKSLAFKAAVFFDFDCTITTSHYFHFRNNLGHYATSKNWSQLFNNAVAKYGLDAVKKASEMADRKSVTTESIYLDLFFGGESGLAEREKFFKSLIKNNCDLYISSKGDCSQIREILDMFDLTPYFVAISSTDYGRDNTGCIATDKNVFIAQHSVRYHTVFFVDDDPDQHQILKTVIKKPYIYFGQMVEKYNTDKLNPELYQVIHDMTPINFGLNKDNNGLSPAMIQIMSNHIVDWNQSTLKMLPKKSTQAKQSGERPKFYVGQFEHTDSKIPTSRWYDIDLYVSPSGDFNGHGFSTGSGYFSFDGRINSDGTTIFIFSGHVDTYYGTYDRTTHVFTGVNKSLGRYTFRPIGSDTERPDRQTKRTYTSGYYVGYLTATGSGTQKRKCQLIVNFNPYGYNSAKLEGSGLILGERSESFVLDGSVSSSGLLYLHTNSSLTFSDGTFDGKTMTGRYQKGSEVGRFEFIHEIRTSAPSSSITKELEPYTKWNGDYQGKSYPVSNPEKFTEWRDCKIKLTVVGGEISISGQGVSVVAATGKKYPFKLSGSMDEDGIFTMNKVHEGAGSTLYNGFFRNGVFEGRYLIGSDSNAGKFELKFITQVAAASASASASAAAAEAVMKTCRTGKYQGKMTWDRNRFPDVILRDIELTCTPTSLQGHGVAVIEDQPHPVEFEAIDLDLIDQHCDHKRGQATIDKIRYTDRSIRAKFIDGLSHTGSYELNFISDDKRQSVESKSTKQLIDEWANILGVDISQRRDWDYDNLPVLVPKMVKIEPKTTPTIAQQNRQSEILTVLINRMK